MKKSNAILLGGYLAAILMIAASLAYVRWGLLPLLINSL